MNQLITNSENSNFFNHLTKLLLECKSFIFNVAFINYSGTQLLLNSLEDCEKRGVKGKILSSTYLDFTDPKALEKLSLFKNIEIKIFDSSKCGFHPKAYIFEFEDEYRVLLGSSNITASAFKTNIEWNIKIFSKKEKEFTKRILFEFQSLWEEAIRLNKEFLEEYKNHKEKEIKREFFYSSKPKINLMQKKALDRLTFFREKGEDKALVIAATGTGKTYLAAFDVATFKPKKMLFIVHRENILKKAKSTFETILEEASCGLLSGNHKQINSNYLFATIQSLSSCYESFKKDEFDYIIYDEAHHISSPSYTKVREYFKPKFQLGLTATPNRMDNSSIYELFDDNIAANIGLNEALKEDLVSSFHYYGIADIKAIDYQSIDIEDISKLAKLLMVNRRVEFIIEKMNFYGNSGKKRKVLGFCVSKEHALYMAEEFSKRGIEALSLTSEDSITKREEVLKRVEDDKDSLEVVFSVDIFNEGVDIPSINTILMLRPTNSSIVFIQQLGRGLRKYKDKEFLTVIDFIGNHKKSFLIALALCGNRVLDKESVKFSLLNNFANFQNTHIVIDEITKTRVLEQLDNENLSSFKYLKDNYMKFKLQLNNKIPMLEDYFEYKELISALPFIGESKSYVEFVNRVEEDKSIKTICKDEAFLKFSRFLDSMLPLRRVYEFAILKRVIQKGSCSFVEARSVVNKYLDNVEEQTIKHSFSYLNQNFFDISQKERFLKVVTLSKDKLELTDEAKAILKDQIKSEFLLNSINYGLLVYEEEFGSKDFKLPFLKPYEKYNMLEIALLSNFDKIHSSFRGSGFLKYKDDFFLFITLEKDKYSKASAYVNTFSSKDTFTFVSKPLMSQDKGDGYRLIDNKKQGVNLHIFVRKFSHVDKKVQKFSYLGLADCIEYNGNKPINTILKLRKELNDELFEEFTKVI
ncbi:DEAD/DEAH box helicase [Halarcobacter ebronensis]|uniref:DNA repair helicase n=1 Tax=Halarcobacter ebronensis TaxID=1462615 RepID=A0A4Q1ASH6_9BACT|nr:DEAD/DEAH box helicase [Halarcobacter ebronensis]QKF80854.1 DNA/RNA helicase (DUF3427 domain) [Halarcobacter ebronensis]RXK08644.1 DNA repair helicase [Halarcobacter ebronensis]